MKKSNSHPKRCDWPGNDYLMTQYHDQEWGVPVYDDRKLFEFLVLDAFQAGLSWKTILHKRENFRRAFEDFEPQTIARFSQKKVEKLLQDPGIIRNRLKITATVTNAQKFLEIQKKEGSFSNYIWKLTGGKPVDGKRKSLSHMPAKTLLSDQMSKELKKAGFKFVGSTICYAFMQAAGMVNDHLIHCFRHAEVAKYAKGIKAAKV
jgi:DNA-3-methyladenine glycosylase I